MVLFKKQETRARRRIYRKWKDNLPDLETASLFRVIGEKKAYDDASGKIYRFDTKTKDAWANLFEYKGSRYKNGLGENVTMLSAGILLTSTASQFRFINM